jgi:hypothetical protein
VVQWYQLAISSPMCYVVTCIGWFIGWVLYLMIGFIAPYIFTPLGLQVMQRYHWFTPFPFHRRTLEFSVFISRILTTDLSQFHCHFKSSMKSSCHSLIPFLSFPFNHLGLPSPELDPIPSTAVLYCFYSSSVKVKVILRLTVSQSWCRAPSGAHD